MNALSGETVQFLAWLVAMVEFILAFYILFLNISHPINRVVSIFFLLAATSSFIIGQLVITTDPTGLIWIVNAALTPVLLPVEFLATISLLKPQWLRRHWITWILLGIAALPVALTLIDVGTGTQFYYTGVNAETYTGGYLSTAATTQGAMGQFVRIMNLSVTGMLTLGFIACAIVLNSLAQRRGAKISSSERALTWLLLGAQVGAAFLQLGLRGVLRDDLSATFSSAFLAMVYTYAAFRQMISERRSQKGRLSVRVTALILAVAIPVFILSVALVGSRSRSRLIEEGDRRLETANQALAANVSVWQDLNRDASGESQDVRSIVSELNVISHRRQISRIGESGYVYVVDEKNQVIAHPDPSSELADLSDYPPVVALQEGTRGLLTFTDNEEQRWRAYVDEIDYGWGVIAQQPESEIQALFRELQRSSWAVMGVGLVLLVGMGVLTIRQAMNPITTLTETVTAIAGGDLDRSAPVESEDELGTLARVFNDMTSQLRELIDNLKTRGAELDEKATQLTERTRELEASQRVTFAASERVSPDELLDLVVNLIRDQFNLYHAQVYIVDDEQNAAVLRQSTGYAGRQLLQRKHKIPLDATALVTKAIHTGEAVLVEDTSKDPNFMPNPLLPETKSELVVPLKLGEQIIGVLDTQDRTPGRFGENTVSLFQSMADQIAILFENSELIARVTEQAESLTIFTTQLRTAAEIARRLGAILSSEQLLEQAAELLQSRYGLYHAHIYVLEEESDRLVMRAGSSEVGRVLRKRGHSIPLNAEKSLVARAARNGEVVLVNDTSLESDFMPNPLLPQTRAEVSIPLIAGEKVLGVLDIQDNQPNRFSEADIDTFSTLAGQIATALQTAGIFEQTRVRLLVSRALAEAQTEEEVLDALAAQADIYPKTQALLLTLDPEADETTVAVRRVKSFESTLPEAIRPGMHFSASEFRLIQVVPPEQEFISPDFTNDERVDPLTRQLLGQMGVNSIARLPFKEGNELIGVLAVLSEEEAYFDTQKLTLYKTLVAQGATAMRIARLNDENLRTAERLKEMDRLKSEFLASMSHELRTPLNSIIGYTEIMLMGLDAELDPEMKEDVQAIYDNGQHLLRIINDVLDLAKIEAGRLTLEMDEIAVEALVDAANSSVAGLLATNDKPVEFQAEVADDLPTLWGDQVRLNQVINNLTSNAVKFTDEGHITLRASRDDGWVCLEIEDTGVGIKEEDLGKIFERFQQADGSNARKAQGTGLGLAISRELVRMHGGNITAKSEVGQGSTFTVRLPVRRPWAEDEAEATVVATVVVGRESKARKR